MNVSQPKFEEFESTPSSYRRIIDRTFFLLCIAVATFSVIILLVLLSSIVIAALPTFGPHADQWIAENRILISQSESTAADVVDEGDIVQGVFAIKSLKRGGLGESNDQSFADENGGVSRFGLYSFVVGEKISDNDSGLLYRLEPALGKDSLAAILKSSNIDAEIDQDTAIVVLQSETATLQLSEAEIDQRLFENGKIVNQIGAGEKWSLAMAAGFSRDTDFVELQLNSSSVKKLEKVRYKKKWGQINGAISIQQFTETDQFLPVKVNRLETAELADGQLKIASEFLKGLRRRSKNGFQMGGDFNLAYCPLSENTAATSDNLAHFVQAIPVAEAPEAGIGPAMMGTLWVVIGCAFFALPIGIGTAIFLEEFKPKNQIVLFLHSVIQVNISNLAGIPSIVYGILGLTAFAWMFGLLGSVTEPLFQFGAEYYHQFETEGGEFVLVSVDGPNDAPKLVSGMAAECNGEPVQLNIIGEDDEYPEDDQTLRWSLYSDAEGGPFSRKHWYYVQLPFGRGVLAASLTLMLVILPVIIISSQEALRAVPSSLREGALGLGSTRWHVIRHVTLPAAIPSIMTGAILSVSRAIGEAAPVLILCGIVSISAGPQHLMDSYSVLPIQIYFWTAEPVDRSLLINFQNAAAGGIVVLLAILLSFNAIAILIRQLTQKPLS